MNNLGLVMGSLFFLMTGGLTLFYSIRDIALFWQERNYKNTIGTINVSEVISVYNSEGPDTYLPKIVCAYEVAGNTYNSRVESRKIEHSFGNKCTPKGSLAVAKHWTSIYPIGRQCPVFYDPARPERARIDKGMAVGGWLATLGIGLTLVVTGVFLTLQMLQSTM